MSQHFSPAFGLDPLTMHKARQAAEQAAIIASLREAASERGEGRRWYVVRTVRQAQAVAERMEAHGVEVFNATLKVLRRRGHGRTLDEVTVALFERYFFVRLNPNDMAFAGVITFEGVDSLLGTGRGPLALPDATMAELFALAHAPAKKPSQRRLLIGGDEVRVAVGPFQGLKGIALGSENEKGVVDIEIEVFGRLTACRMGIDDLEKLP